jgi:hypothetical protein
MLAPGCSPWRPQQLEPATSPDAVTDGGGGADMQRASIRRYLKSALGCLRCSTTAVCPATTWTSAPTAATSSPRPPKSTASPTGSSRNSTATAAAHTARAILLISDHAHIYEGSQDHPFGSYIGESASGTEPVPPGPAGRDIVILSASELSTVAAALDDATLYKRDWGAPRRAPTAPTSLAPTASGAFKQPIPTPSWPLSSPEQRRPHEPQPPASLTPQKTGKSASDPAARRRRAQPQAPTT